MQPRAEFEPAASAEGFARELLAGLGDRWAHTKGVAAAAEKAAGALLEAEGQVLVSAAWLHDIGYAPRCVRTGFHAMDGATELLDRGFSVRLAALVAHHSFATYEAAVRGLDSDLARFPRESGEVADALVWADMTTDPQGNLTSACDRIAEILDRYPAHDPVHEAVASAAPGILAAVLRTEDRLAVLVR